MEQFVKRMQKFLHRFFLAGNKLHVVHQQDVPPRKPPGTDDGERILDWAADSPA